jgi:hypothetical protein
MEHPFKKEEFIPSSPKKTGGCALFLFILGAFSGATWYGVAEFLERV